MTDGELHLIMSAFENHRADMRADMKEVKDSIAATSLVVAAHQKRFDALDTVAFIVGKVMAVGTVVTGSLWALFTWKWGK